MQITPTLIPDVKILTPKCFSDPRGLFCETWSKLALQSAGLNLDFVQDNHSISSEKGTIRGLHFQLPPFAQDKLIRVIRGSALDIAVDIRRSSPTFGKHVAVLLTADNWQQIFVPAGFAHGFVTLEANTEVLYKVTRPYSQPHDRGILWNDPDLAINWGFPDSSAILSDKDRKHPRLKDAPNLF